MNESYNLMQCKNDTERIMQRCHLNTLHDRQPLTRNTLVPKQAPASVWCAAARSSIRLLRLLLSSDLVAVALTASKCFEVPAQQPLAAKGTWRQTMTVP